MRISSALVGFTLLVAMVSGCGVSMPAPVDTTPVQAPAEVTALTVRVGNILPRRTSKQGVPVPITEGDEGYVDRVRAALKSALTRVGYKVVSDDEASDVIVHVEYVRDNSYLEDPKVTHAFFGGSIAVAHDETLIDPGTAEYFNGADGEDAFARRLVNVVSKSTKLAAFARTPRTSETATARAKPAAPASRPVGAPSPSSPPSASPSSSSAPSSYLVASPQPAAYALIIGIEKYRDVPSPTGARSDAEKFAKLARQTLGVPEAHIKVALDDRATKGDIEKHLEWLKANAQPGSRIYFFFSGHGAPEPSTGTSYVLPYDGDPRYLDGTALRLQTVLTRLQETKAREVLAVLDSCFSGAGGRSVLPPGARALVRVQAAPTTARIALFSASSGTETSGPAPGAAEGLFTQKILEGLGRGEADINGDGQISLEELRDWVRPRVTREAKRDNRDQTPSLSLGSNVGAASSFMLAWGLASK